MAVVSIIGPLLVLYLSPLTGKKLAYLVVFVVFTKFSRAQR